MNITTSAIVLVCAATTFTSSAHAADNLETLKQTILAQARAVGPEDLAFTRTVRSEEVGAGKTEQHVLIEKWDPSKASDQRWTFVSIDGRPPNADELGKYRKSLAARRVTSYGRVAEYFGAPATNSVDNRGRTVFSFGKLPKGTVLINDVDLSGDAKAEATVSEENGTPFVQEVRFTSAKATRVKLIAVIESLEATTRYHMMPNGKPAPAEQTTDMVGSLLGKHGRIRTTISYSEQRAAR